ncbi:MAG: hypothetical protein SOU51_03535 [Collinsella sp.]|nr:hypothetical protein [Collinsella sp.]
MDLPIDTHDIEYAENFLASGDIATALPLLKRLTEMVEEHVERECADTERTQWFSFNDAFERLAYRRVENDPRELVQMPAPLDRLYAALAFAYIREQEWLLARDALMQAVRWNPMNCNYRLDLAEIFRALEDRQEWASLSYSVIERASDSLSAARAYANLGQFFLDEDRPTAASGCSRLALALAPTDPRVSRLANRLMGEHPEVAEESDDHVMGELSLEGIPTTPNAEIAICLLMCATDAARDGDSQAATDFTIRAHNLVGQDAAKALLKLIHESDAELAADKEAAEGSGTEPGSAGE